MRLFITGTDTDAGKTYISVGLLKCFKHLGLSTIGLKPVASGCDSHLKNADALLLQQTATIPLDYALVNPYAFMPPIAPHLAAKEVNVTLTVDEIINKMQPVWNIPADIYLMEGAGGWYVPLNQHETMVDVVKKLNFATILVVNIRLGCINHAILTAKAIQHEGVKFLGWIANSASHPYPLASDVITTLKHYIPVPCLGIVNHGEKPEDVISLSLDNLRVTG